MFEFKSRTTFLLSAGRGPWGVRPDRSYGEPTQWVIWLEEEYLESLVWWGVPRLIHAL